MIYLLLMMGVFLFFAIGCDKDENPALDNPTNGKSTAVFNPALTYGTMTDQDGNVYKTVTIGTQTWMAENLRTTKYNDGTLIPNNVYWNYLNRSSNEDIATFGYLYNYHAVNTRKLAPKGWHVPTDAEWTILTNFLGGESEAGSKLKEIGITHWNSPNQATNETGFTALPGGFRSGSLDDFAFIGDYGFWWSSTEYTTDLAWIHNVFYSNITVFREYSGKNNGYSVRCLRD